MKRPRTLRKEFFRVFYLVVAGAMAFLGGLVYGIICPVVQPGSTFADGAASTLVTATLDDIIAISAPTSASITLTPSANSSAFSTTSVAITVSTNNYYGYSLTMGTSGTDSSENLTTDLTSSSSSSTIPSITSDIANITTGSYTDFTDNSWGFTTDNNGIDTSIGQITANTYKPLTTTNSPSLIKSTDATAALDQTTVTFAAKVNQDQPAGGYSNIVVFSAIANLRSEPLANISTMQQMTSEICAANPTYEENGKTYSLIDVRDGNAYAVRKLADGNCWMVENLALGTDDSAGLTLSSEDSDVTGDWTLPRYDEIGATWERTTEDAHIVQGATGRIEVNGSATAEPYNVTDWQEGMGNWYTWGAATAETGVGLTSGEASGSICPNGWQLPLADGWGSTLDKSYANLYRAYDLTEQSVAAVETIVADPIALTAAGGYYPSTIPDYSTNGDTVMWVGGYGGYWLAGATDGEDGRTATESFFYSYTGRASPKNSYFRGTGRSVRCVAQ